MIVKLLTEHHLEFLSLKEETQTRLSLHLSKCQIVGNLMPRLKYHLQCRLCSECAGILIQKDMHVLFNAE